MDEDRRIRFLVAPLLFFASLAWGLLRDGTRSLSDVLPSLGLKLDKIPDLVALLTGGGIAVFALGYVIGTSSYVLLRLAFLLKACVCGGSGSHEISLSGEALDEVWKKIGATGTASRAQEFFAGVTFDHDVLRTAHDGVHRWLVRRWNAFSVAVTSVTGLVLSVSIGALMRIKFSVEWWVPVAIVSTVLCVSAILAWRDTMGMLRFQATRRHDGAVANKGMHADAQENARG
ncbi:MAG: hypothetical protein ACHQ9S_12710 [Candidatus Binatia bacterium]